MAIPNNKEIFTWKHQASGEAVMINSRGRCDVVETVAELWEFNDEIWKSSSCLGEFSEGNIEKPTMQCVEGTDYLKGVCNARIREI